MLAAEAARVAGRGDRPGWRRALVTGASSGIGAAFARRLARDGTALALVARSREALDALAAELRGAGSSVEVVAADLTRADELRSVEQLAAAPPGFDLLVNNAGLGTVGPFAECDPDREEHLIALNAVALTRLTRAALPPMLEAGRGAVVNVSSLAGLVPYPFSAVYGASKAYVNHFSESLAEELRGRGVRVQVLCPGFIRTRFQERAGADASRVPGFAWMQPDAVADASLAALEGGALLCVPGLGYRALAATTGALPRSLVRRLMGAVQGARYRD